MHVEFHRADAPEKVVATATWDGRRALIEAEADDMRAAVEHLFRPTPVVVDDGAYRAIGTRGEVVLQPGTLEWFRAAAFARGAAAGLVARSVPGIEEGGWDPAAQYRTFSEAIGRLRPRSG